MRRVIYAALCALIVLLCCAPLLQAGDCRGVLQIQQPYIQQQVQYIPVQQQQAFYQPQAVQQLYYTSPVQRLRVLQQVDAYGFQQPQFRQGFRQRQFVPQPLVFTPRQFRQQSRFAQQVFVPQPVVLQQSAGTTFIRERSIGPFGIFGRSRTVIQQ